MIVVIKCTLRALDHEYKSAAPRKERFFTEYCFVLFRFEYDYGKFSLCCTCMLRKLFSVNCLRMSASVVRDGGGGTKLNELHFVFLEISRWSVAMEYIWVKRK